MASFCVSSTGGASPDSVSAVRNAVVGESGADPDEPPAGGEPAPPVVPVPAGPVAAAPVPVLVPLPAAAAASPSEEVVGAASDRSAVGSGSSTVPVPPSVVEDPPD